MTFAILTLDIINRIRCLQVLISKTTECLSSSGATEQGSIFRSFDICVLDLQPFWVISL
jgi:hypothetical protein